MAKVERMILLGLVLLSISTSALADEGASQKPEDWDRRLEMLRAVPYISYSKALVDKSDAGVLLYNPEKAYDGYNFYCTRSSGEAFLFDMNGQVVHRWLHSLRRAHGEDYAVMLENGDLVAIVDNRKMLRLNWDSELIWKKELVVHHDVAPAPDGSFYVLAREQRNHRGMRVVFPTIVHLNAEGEEIDRWSTCEHLADIQSVLNTRFFLDTLLDSIFGGRSEASRIPNGIKTAMGPGRHHYDYFHMNTVNVLPATNLGDKDSRFQPGNLLVCFRNVNQIAVLEKDTYSVLWAWGEGELQWPHHPTMLENGHILIFDNGFKRKYSRVVELDPVSETVVWQYVAEPREAFFSSLGGSAQRLPNGNTLVCDSDNGRAFEITGEGEVVWLWLNPVTREGRRQVLYRIFRRPTAEVDRLLRKWLWWE